MGTLIKPKELHDQPVLRPSLSPLSLSTTLITTAASWLGSNLESTTDWEEKKAGKRRNKKKGSVVSGQTHADAVIPSSPVHFVFVNQYHGSGYEALANSSVQSLFHLKEKTVESVVGIHECRNNDLFLSPFVLCSRINLCGNPGMFTNLDTGFSHSVKLENDTRMKVAGKGVVKLMLNGINYAIGDVYCVPELKNNLLSPKGYEMKGSEQMVYNLQKALYGLKQAPRAWFSRIESYFLKEGFKSSPSEQTLFIKKVGGKIFIVSIYVDDLMFTSNDDTVLSDFKCYMKEFEMTDLGELKFFLGIESNSVQNPIVPGKKVCSDEDGTKVDTTLFKQMVGSLMFLTATRLDLMFVVSLISRYMAKPTQLHFAIAKRTLRYLRGTVDFGVYYKKDGERDLLGFTDSDYAGDVEDNKSTSRHVFMMNGGAVAWSSRKQPIVTLSTTEAEFVAVVSCACQAMWMRKILREVIKQSILNPI
ncbi:hypothetical protein ACLB2K_044623 [Fragaria x ananassa]